MVLAYILFSLTIIALTEYIFHRWLMHRRKLPRIIYRVFPFLNTTFDKHHVQHHCFKRHDINVDLPVWWALLLASPLAAIGYVFDPIFSVVWLTISAAYAIIWTGAHRYSHDIPGTYGIEHWYPFLAKTVKHHLEHHEHTNKNYGTVFMITDRIFGTKYHEN